MVTLLIGRILQMVLTVLQIRLATSMLGPAEYGKWILYLTLVSFCVLLGISPLGLYLNRHINEWESKKQMPQVFQGYTLYIIFFSFLSFIFFLLVQHFNFLGTNSIIYTSILLTALLFSQTFNQTWISALNFFGKRKSYVLSSTLTIAFGIGFVLLLSFFGHNSVNFWGIGVGLGSLLASLFFIPRKWYIISIPTLMTFIRNLEFKNIFYFSAPLFFSTLFFWMQSQGYRFLVENKIGLENFGKFAAGQAVVVGLFAALESVVASYYQPVFFKNLHEGSSPAQELEKVWKLCLYPFFLAAFFLFVLGSDLSDMFLKKDFLGENSWIGWVAITELCRVVFNLFAMNFQASKKTTSIVLPHLAGLIVSFGIILFKKELSFVDLSCSLAIGYFVSIFILFYVDSVSFIASRVVPIGIYSFLLSLAYFILAKMIALNFSGIPRIGIVSLLGLFFILPYYTRLIRRP